MENPSLNILLWVGNGFFLRVRSVVDGIFTTMRFRRAGTVIFRVWAAFPNE